MPLTPVLTTRWGAEQSWRLETYERLEGYAALRTALSMAPDALVTLVKDSGLRGRGGAGFPTGLKWRTVAKGGGDRKFVICNGDEGDPGAFMDRSVLESDPHRVHRPRRRPRRHRRTARNPRAAGRCP